MLAHCTPWPAAPFPRLSMAPVATIMPAGCTATPTWARQVPATDAVRELGALQLEWQALHAVRDAVADALHRLRELDEDVRLGPSTGSIVYAAVARNIPYRRLTKGSLVQFGWQQTTADRKSVV